MKQATKTKRQPKAAAVVEPVEVEVISPNVAESMSLVTYSTESGMIESSVHNMNAIEMIKKLPSMPDEKLKDIFTSAAEARRLLFVINGAASHEIYKRASERGETFTTKKGQGISELFRDLSLSSGLDLATLRDDFRIWDEFEVILLDYLANFPERILPREFWLLAVKTPAPQTTLQYFEMQRDSVSYYVQHARRDTKKFNQGLGVDQILREDLEERAQAMADMAAAKAEGAPEPVSSGEKAEAEVRKEKLVSVGLPENTETLYYVRQIIEKYGSFSGWFLIRAKEEFGDVAV
jgi:hypothetical protein